MAHRYSDRGAHHFAAAAAGESNGMQAHFAGGKQSLKDVWRIAAGRNADSDVSLSPKSFNLARKKPGRIHNRCRWQ